MCCLSVVVGQEEHRRLPMLGQPAVPDAWAWRGAPVAYTRSLAADINALELCSAGLALVTVCTPAYGKV